MDIPALLTSAGMNIGISVGAFSLYSVMRKQPLNVRVYFGQRIAQQPTEDSQYFCFDRLVPSAGWILKAWEATEEDIFASGGVDAVAFLRMVVFSIRIFSIAAILCTFLVLPLNYFGQGMELVDDSTEMDVLTITNVVEGSQWLWAHCLTLYIITACACTLLYFEYKHIAKLSLGQVTRFPTRPSNFAVLVRGIPWSAVESYSESVEKFFSNYYSSSYISHQIVYRSGAVEQLMSTLLETEKMYKVMTTATATPIKKCCEPNVEKCGLCGANTNSFKTIDRESESEFPSRNYDDELKEKESEAALVFFKSRYDALVVSHTIQSADPMLWVTDMAPEPKDVFWSNLCVPYKLLWIRKISIFIASVVFSVLFLLPTTFVQGLTKLPELQYAFPFLRGVLERRYILLITGYLPSLVLTIFLIIVPPTMNLFATLQGAISRSTRKKSACTKVIIFLFWNVFFSNILSGSWLERMGKLTVTSPKELATLFAELIPRQASFFMTYIMTSGWSGLSFELMQPVGLLGNWLFKCVLMKKEEFCKPMCFPYHTEVPKVLLFGLFGFTFCILAPLILPFLLVYFSFAYLVYRNQIMNVYITKYNTDGSYWPVAHSATIFSLILTQTVAMILFALKKSSTVSTSTIPLIICTALFNVFCKNRFLPLFKNRSAQVLIEMDRDDASSGKLEEILENLKSEYSKSQMVALTGQPQTVVSDKEKKGSDQSLKDAEILKPEASEKAQSSEAQGAALIDLEPSIVSVK